MAVELYNNLVTIQTKRKWKFGTIYKRINFSVIIFTIMIHTQPIIRISIIFFQRVRYYYKVRLFSLYYILSFLKHLILFLYLFPITFYPRL